MNVTKFNVMLEKRIEATKKVLASKNKEYASDIDKLHNFKRAGAMENCTSEKALVGMWAKHIISLLDMVDKIEAAQKIQSLDLTITKEMLEEKIGDAVNYLILLEALIKERYSW